MTLRILYALSIFRTRMYSSGMHTARLLTASQHALPRGVSAWGCLYRGVSAWGCVCLWGVNLGEGGSAQGVCLPRGCLRRGGVCPWGCLPGCSLSSWCLPGGVWQSPPGPEADNNPPPHEKNDRQVKKHYLAATSLRADIKTLVLDGKRTWLF